MLAYFAAGPEACFRFLQFLCTLPTSRAQEAADFRTTPGVKVPRGPKSGRKAGHSRNAPSASSAITAGAGSAPRPERVSFEISAGHEASRRGSSPPRVTQNGVGVRRIHWYRLKVAVIVAWSVDTKSIMPRCSGPRGSPTWRKSPSGSRGERRHVVGSEAGFVAKLAVGALLRLPWTAAATQAGTHETWSLRLARLLARKPVDGAPQAGLQGSLR